MEGPPRFEATGLESHPTEAVLHDVRRIVDAFLERAPELILQAMRRLQGEVPAFAAFPAEALLEGGLRIVQMVLPVTAECRRPTADELQAYVELARDRLGRGIPLDTYLVALQMVTRDYALAGARIGDELGVTPEAIAAYTNSVWQYSNLGGQEIIRQLRAVEAQRLGEADRRVADLMMSIVSSTATETEVEHRLLEAGRRPGSEVQPIVAAPTHDSDLPRLRRFLGDSAAGRWQLIAVRGPRVYGLVEAPWVAPADLGWATVAVGPPARASRVAMSSALAVRALDLASTTGARGVLLADELLLPLAMHHDPNVTRRLLDRFVDPVLGAGDFGDVLLETVRAHLAAGARVEATARLFNIHQNTVRYRLGRFSALTGADLSDLGSRLAVWWALEAAPFERSDGTAEAAAP